MTPRAVRAHACVLADGGPCYTCCYWEPQQIPLEQSVIQDAIAQVPPGLQYGQQIQQGPAVVIPGTYKVAAPQQPGSYQVAAPQYTAAQGVAAHEMER